MFNEKWQKKLDLQKENGLYRNPVFIEKRTGKTTTINDREVVNFSSNDYLGIATLTDLKLSASKNFLKYGTSSSSSRLVSANYSAINEAERRFADFFGYEEALFFPSGFQCNQGLVSSILEPEDIAIFDKHLHASSVKGLVLSKGEFTGYKHNSMSHLEKKCIQHKEKFKAVLTESLFSMDGDLLDVNEFKKLKDKYSFLSVIDEAHSFGALGEGGRGIARDAADIAVGTFGKALGFFGAFVLMPSILKEYLLNFSSQQIYTTTLPEAHAATAMEILDIVEKAEDRRSHLKEMSEYMKNELKNLNLKVLGEAHIISPEIGPEKLSAKISKKLLSHGYFVLPARYPTVPMGKSILRISMTALHEKSDIDGFVDALKKVMSEN